MGEGEERACGERETAEEAGLNPTDQFCLNPGGRPAGAILRSGQRTAAPQHHLSPRRGRRASNPAAFPKGHHSAHAQGEITAGQNNEAHILIDQSYPERGQNCPQFSSESDTTV